MAEHVENVRAPLEIRATYKGNLLRYRDPVARVAQTSARRRERLETDTEYRQRLRDQSRAYAARHPESVRARQLVRNAIRRGEIVRASVCEHCGAETFIEAAHEDYSKPLVVRWLCRSCHRRWDRDEPKAAAA